MHWTRVLGIALLVGGVLLLWMGIAATDSVGEDLRHTVTGSYSDSTTAYLVGGGVAAAVGLVLVLFGARR